MTYDEFDKLAVSLGVDRTEWRAAIDDEMFDNDGMPVVHYPSLDVYVELMSHLDELDGIVDSPQEPTV